MSNSYKMPNFMLSGSGTLPLSGSGTLPLIKINIYYDILVPRALLTRGATRVSGQIHNRIPQKHGKKTMSGVRTSQSDASSEYGFGQSPLVAPRVRRALGTRMCSRPNLKHWSLSITEDRKLEARHCKIIILKYEIFSATQSDTTWPLML
jgi:hypothetical protein